MGFIENTVAFVFVLGVMVLVHELGHFLAARYFNVRVESFSIGFGPRLVGFRRGDTDYKICLLPIGGYVKMAGENMGEPTGDPEEFLAKPRWQRLIIVAMGPIFNVLLAIALPLGLYMFHFERYSYLSQPAEVAYVEQDSPAEQAGVEPGDRILSIDHESTLTWEDVRLTEVAAVHRTVPVTVVRDGEEQTLTLTFAPDARGVGYAGWLEEAPVRLGQTAPGSPASQADIEPGDFVVAIDGEPMESVAEVMDVIQSSGGRELTLALRRGDDLVETKVAPRLEDTEEGEIYRIGVELGPEYERTVTKLSLGESLAQSLDDNRKNATLIVRFLSGLVEQRMSPKSLEGPIGIARLSGQAARTGWPELILLMSAISLNLGIFNLLPIPILDGGVILMLLFESAMRRDISVAVKERIVQVGLVFLVLLFAFVMYNDILKSLPSG